MFSNLINYRNEQVPMFLELCVPLVPTIMRIIEIGAALGIMGIMGIMRFWGSPHGASRRDARGATRARNPAARQALHAHASLTTDAAQHTSTNADKGQQWAHEDFLNAQRISRACDS